MHLNLSRSIPFSLSALSFAMFAVTAQADTAFDIKVSYYDTSVNTNSRKAAIEANINSFADALYEATNGAHRIRNVTIYADGAFKDDTDILWVNKCHPNATINGRDNKGSRIEHCDNFSDSQNYLLSTVWGGFTLMHEWGHFTYGMFDEYQNTKEACNPADAGGPCKDDTPVPNSLMHSQDNAANAENMLLDLSWLNFSTPKNNTKNTAQHRVYGLSSWETLVRNSELDSDTIVQNSNNIRRKYYADLVAVAPAADALPSIEIDKAENLTKAKSILKFIWKTSADTTVANGVVAKAANPGANLTVAKTILIERSSNISASVLEEVKLAVQQIVEQANIGDVIGVIAFDAKSTEIVPPTTIASEATKTAILTAIQGIKATSQPSALGDALSSAVTAFKAAKLPANSVSAVYLFADGFSPAGTLKPLSQIEALQQEGISVFSFGLSNDFAVNTLLRQIAEKTRGDHYLAVKNNVLVKAIQQAEARISPSVDTIIAQDTVNLTNGQSVPFYIDSTLGSAELVVSYEGAVQGASFSVLDPTGKVTPLNSSACLSEEGADANSNSNNCNLKLPVLVEGGWKLQLSRTGNEPLSVFYSVTGEPKDNNSALATSADSVNGIAGVGSAVVLTAKVEEEFPITNLTVTGKLEKPDATSVSLDWHDDGVKPDKKAKDGLYTASFVASTAGEYLASVNFDNLDNKGQVTNLGATYAVNNGPGNFANPLNIKFTRVATTDVVATEVTQGATTLSDYERVMNWGEAVVAPQILPVKGKQILTIAPYKVRFYPQSNTYLGFNPADGNLYIYNPAIYGKDIVLLGPLATYLTAAKQDGF